MQSCFKIIKRVKSIKASLYKSKVWKRVFVRFKQTFYSHVFAASQVGTIFNSSGTSRFAALCVQEMRMKLYIGHYYFHKFLYWFSWQCLCAVEGEFSLN